MFRKIAFALTLLVMTACLGLPTAPVSAKLFNAENRLVGFVDLLETKGGVEVRVHTLGLPAGRHGLNLHVNPTCEPPGFASAGPVLAVRATPNDSVAMGDLPDITTFAAEWSDTTFAWAGLELNDGEHGVFHQGGTSLVITAEPDQGSQAPGSGERIACGVIKPRPEVR
jgi:Cu-Zn family superoxide dismutase